MFSILAQLAVTAIKPQFSGTSIKPPTTPLPIPEVVETSKKSTWDPKKAGRKVGDLYSKEAKIVRILKMIWPSIEFKKVRPQWLLNPHTQKPLELDLYNSDLNLAFEYNGPQHYQYMQHYHKEYKEFERAQERDQIKIVRCAQQGVNLVIISCYEIQKLETDVEWQNFILSKLSAAGFMARK
jgi:hypothetical protein